MDWSILAPTALGGLLALGGGFGGQWWSERRAVAREQRDREHEVFIWARNLRLESHLRFLSVFDLQMRLLDEASRRGEESDAPEDFVAPLMDLQENLRLMCSEETADRAFKALLRLNDYANKKGIWEDAMAAREAYLAAIRDEFKLPPIRKIPY